MSALQRMGGWFSGFAGKAQEHLPVRLGSRRPGLTAAPVRLASFDQVLLWVTVALLAWGLVMVYSASIAMPDNPRFSGYTHNYFLVRHTMWLGISFVAALIAFQIPVSQWEKYAPWLFVVALILLVAVLIPGIGKGVNGARRWLMIGPMTFQPSELAKFAVLLYAADYMVRKMEVKERFFRAVMPMAVAIGIVGLLLLAEPDMGAVMVISVIAMGGDCICTDGDAQRLAPRADIRLPRPLEREIRAGQGLPAVAFADRFRTRRVFWGRPGRQH